MVHRFVVAAAALLFLCLLAWEGLSGGEQVASLIPSASDHDLGGHVKVDSGVSLKEREHCVESVPLDEEYTVRSGFGGEAPQGSGRSGFVACLWRQNDDLLPDALIEVLPLPRGGFVAFNGVKAGAYVVTVDVSPDMEVTKSEILDSLEKRLLAIQSGIHTGTVPFSLRKEAVWAGKYREYVDLLNFARPLLLGPGSGAPPVIVPKPTMSSVLAHLTDMPGHRVGEPLLFVRRQAGPAAVAPAPVSIARGCWISGLPDPGKYVLQGFWPTGSVTSKVFSSVPVEIEAAGGSLCRVELVARNGEGEYQGVLRGCVRGAAGHLIRGVAVECYLSDKGPVLGRIGSCCTDDAGLFEFEHLPEAKVSVAIFEPRNTVFESVDGDRLLLRSPFLGAEIDLRGRGGEIAVLDLSVDVGLLWKLRLKRGSSASDEMSRIMSDVRAGLFAVPEARWVESGRSLAAIDPIEMRSFRLSRTREVGAERGGGIELVVGMDRFVLLAVLEGECAARFVDRAILIGDEIQL